MLTRPSDLPDPVVVDSLRELWGLAVTEIEYAPVGFGSYHWRVTAGRERWFVTVDDLQRKRRDRSASGSEPLRRLSAALSTARSLRSAGLSFVIAPRPCRSGDILCTIEGRFALAVYPYVDGRTHCWGAYPTRGDRLAVLDLLTALHAAPESARRPALVDDLVIPHRDRLDAALDDLRGPWDAGPYGEPARRLLDRHAGTVTRALRHHDRLAAHATGETHRLVPTHGEPHRANTITTASGVVLVDWDTTLLAPPERDLWAVADQEPRILTDYADRTGTTPDVNALRAYRSWWYLAETCIFIGQFREAHEETEDTRLAWGALHHVLDGRHAWLRTLSLQGGTSIDRHGAAGAPATRDVRAAPRGRRRVRSPAVTEPRAERPHMPDYGVDTPSWAPLPWTWAADRLTDNRNFWVVTVSAVGRPHALPVWGVWDRDEHRFAFSCGPHARKARNLAVNPRAVVAIDDTVECLSVEGRAGPVEGTARQDQWIERYLAKYRPISPDLDAGFLRRNLIVEFAPERAFAIIEREDEFSTRATRWVFEG